jgi:hypothetical protein
MLYGNASALQIGLYVWNRRHNVSPHEPEGSGGVAGMIMSALSAPIYARSLMDAVLRRKSKFVVTPKGDSASPDTLLGTFRIHLFFILVFAGSIVAGLLLGHSHPAMITWACFALLITASPILAWQWALRQAKKKPSVPPASPEETVPLPAQASAPQQEQHTPHAPHAPQHKPSWAAAQGQGGGSGAGNDQTMQISLGGRKK